MGRKDILKNLIEGSQSGQHGDNFPYKRFLLECVKQDGWSAVVQDIASWLHHTDINEVDAALIEYLAQQNDCCKGTP